MSKNEGKALITSPDQLVASEEVARLNPEYAALLAKMKQLTQPATPQAYSPPLPQKRSAAPHSRRVRVGEYQAADEERPQPAPGRLQVVSWPRLAFKVWLILLLLALGFLAGFVFGIWINPGPFPLFWP